MPSKSNGYGTERQHDPRRRVMGDGAPGYKPHEHPEGPGRVGPGAGAQGPNVAFNPKTGQREDIGTQKMDAAYRKNSGVKYGPNNLPPDMYDDDGPSAEDEERMGGPWTSAMWRKTAPAPDRGWSERRWY